MKTLTCAWNIFQNRAWKTTSVREKFRQIPMREILLSVREKNRKSRAWNMKSGREKVWKKSSYIYHRQYTHYTPVFFPMVDLIILATFSKNNPVQPSSMVMFIERLTM